MSFRVVLLYHVLFVFVVLLCAVMQCLRVVSCVCCYVAVCCVMYAFEGSQATSETDFFSSERNVGYLGRGPSHAPTKITFVI